MHLREELQITKPLEPGHEVALALLLTREYVARLFDQALYEREDISDQQFNLLRILKGGPRDGYLVKDLRSRMIYRFADVPRLVNRLEARGLVKRCENPADRRGSRVQITPKGLALEARMHTQHHALCQRVDECLEPGERDLLLSLLERLRNDFRTQVEALEK
ncbi:MarR family winged helix-turn-helix transcriptional regulator [Geothrix sp. 21YS21S-4]|uniref:MarR family winged helix-turn-helix transcriptional regulator n=1 Tax=Geothrix sp. 21YS21S-4 TaxID=3068889 RepID=UPI0027BA43BA|nr:MarR family transcriptional regulator [Geothrix sp. 21YS21S-4]